MRAARAARIFYAVFIPVGNYSFPALDFTARLAVY
jgi:hypothetical protein